MKIHIIQILDNSICIPSTRVPKTFFLKQCVSCQVWYSFLTKSIPGSTFTQALQRTFIDQVCFAPLFVPTFLTSLLLLENEKSIHEIKAILKKDIPDMIVTNWSLWAPAMIINFRFVPVQWQVLYSNNVAFIWNMYLSWKTQEQDKDL